MKQLSISLFLLVYLFLNSCNQVDDGPGNDYFITTWQTAKPGVSNNTSITIPIDPKFTYNYDVDWDNDGDFDEFGITESVTHDFGSTGTFTIAIRGDFPAIRFEGYGDCQKIISIDNWGNIEWKSFENAFERAENLIYNAHDTPDLSQVTNMQGMFNMASSFNGVINNWDVSNVENMNWMFVRAFAFNQDLDQWDVSNVKTMHGMFSRLDIFNGDISTWDVSNVKDMSYMFVEANAFNSDISNWDVSSVTNMEYMLEETTSFTANLSNWDVSNVTKMNSMFARASAFNSDISSWNVSKVTTFYGMFSDASSFNVDISSWDVSNAVVMSSMFRRASSFDQDLGKWDICNVTLLNDMLSYSGLSVENYDNTLIGWSNCEVKDNLGLGVRDLTYCEGKDAREKMITEHNWQIYGDVYDCTE